MTSSFKFFDIEACSLMALIYLIIDLSIRVLILGHVFIRTSREFSARSRFLVIYRLCCSRLISFPRDRSCLDSNTLPEEVACANCRCEEPCASLNKFELSNSPRIDEGHPKILPKCSNVCCTCTCRSVLDWSTCTLSNWFI